MDIDKQHHKEELELIKDQLIQMVSQIRFLISRLEEDGYTEVHT